MYYQKIKVMKPKSLSVKRVTYVVDLDTELANVTLTVTRSSDEGTKSASQVYNLDIIPLDMVMSQVCNLIMPKQR